MARTCISVILAAGQGTRMRSRLPKVLHAVAGMPMVGHVLNAARAAGVDTQAVVVGNGAEAVRETVSAMDDGVEFHEQAERLGTAHAVLAARPALERGHDDVLVLFADTPLLRPETFGRLRGDLAAGAAVSVLGFRAADPSGYGRMIVEGGQLIAIREERDCSEAERVIDFCNGGIMAIAGAHALELLSAVGNDNAKGEYYLTDIVEIARARGLEVTAAEAGEDEIMGINTRADLARAEAIWQQRRRSELLDAGVSMTAPETVFFSHDTQVGADVMIEPQVFFSNGVTIADNVVVHAYSHLEGCSIAAGANIGPFARLRPGVEIGEGAKVGNFCEVKNARIEPGAKINHLTYIGDARIGAKANIGAGTITCNYDGVLKHHTDIGAGAFIGSNTSLVAPVSVGDGAYVASGSVVVSDVPADALAIARQKQVVKEGRAADLRARLAAQKAKRQQQD